MERSRRRAATAAAIAERRNGGDENWMNGAGKCDLWKDRAEIEGDRIKSYKEAVLAVRHWKTVDGAGFAAAEL